MAKKTVRDLPAHVLQGSRVLARFDLNVSINENGDITGDRRIRASLNTCQILRDAGARVIVMSHLGRPDLTKGPDFNRPFRMDKVARKLGEYLGATVRKVDEVVGPAVTEAVASLRLGEVLVLENVRFHPGEQSKDESKKREFAQELARLGDIYVNDAFGTLHNKDVTVLALPGVMKDRPRVIGLLVEKELRTVDEMLSRPARPLLGIMGGAKVSDKIKFIRVLLKQVDQLLIGGAMAYTFLRARGNETGNSRVETVSENKDGTKTDILALAKELLAEAGNKIVLPFDHLTVDRFEATANTQVTGADIPAGWMGIDIGPQTIAKYGEAIAAAKTVIWNGPMGLFEWGKPFENGTRAIAEAMSQSSHMTIVGGGETAEAVEAFGLADRISHVSTGGGAFLKYVEERKFQTLDQIEDM